MRCNTSILQCRKGRADGSPVARQAAHNHGVQSNNPGGRAAWWTFKEKDGNTLPVWLKAAGYKTALLGKYVNGYGKKEKPRRSDRQRSDSFYSRLGRWETLVGQYLSLAAWRGWSQKVSGFVMRASVLLGAA